MIDTTKKRKVKRVSKIGIKTYLNLTDERFLKEKLKEGLLDEKGKHLTMSSIIRKYVHLGLVNEKNTQHAQYSLRDQVVRKSLFRLMDEFMSPMQTSINKLIEENTALRREIDYTLKKNDSNSIDLMHSISNLKDDLILEFGKVKTDRYSELSFKNLFILRAVFYVFLLGYHHKTIPNDKSAEEAWIEIVKVVHRKAGELSLEELVEKDADGLENEIKKLAGTSYREAKESMDIS